MKQLSRPQLPRRSLLRQLLQIALAQKVSLRDMQVYVPGTLPIRFSVIMGNLRMQRMLDLLVKPGATVVDVGANIGYNTLYAASLTGAQGSVYAIEPAQDNLAFLYANLLTNHLTNVVVLPYAASGAPEVRNFFLRGEVSAVNSLYPDNFYAEITDKVEVLAVPLDDLISGTPDVVKIDVEGGELDVLRGMKRIVQAHTVRLIIEWHPTLQAAAGHAADELPRHLFAQGFTLHVVTHTSSTQLHTADIPSLTARLLQARRPVELLAFR